GGPMRIALTSAVLSLLFVAAPRTFAQTESAGLVGKDAPEIQTSDWIGSDGRTRVADYKGEVLLMESFATWCGPCRASMQHLTELTRTFGKRGLTVLSITQESRETVLQFLAQLNTSPVEYTIGVGGGNAEFRTQTIPHAWLISTDGKVVWEGMPGGLSD